MWFYHIPWALSSLPSTHITSPGPPTTPHTLSIYTESIPLSLFIPPAKLATEGFPGGAVVEDLPANAGDAGSGPGLGGSHVPRGGWARGPRLLGLRVWSLCLATGGAAVVGGPRTAMKSGPRTAVKSGPRLPQLEKALARTEDPTQPKINK